MLIIFIHVRFLILLTVFELLPKTCNFTICSIFSNSGHVGWCTASPDTILKLDTLVMIQTKFGFHWSSTFRGEDFWKSLRRTTTTDDKWWQLLTWPFGSGELKKNKKQVKNWKQQEIYSNNKHKFMIKSDHTIFIYLYRQYMYIVSKNKIYLYKL